MFLFHGNNGIKTTKISFEPDSKIFDEQIQTNHI